MENKKKYLCSMLILTTLLSCNNLSNDKKEELQSVINAKGDSIIYELPTESTAKILELIKNHKVSSCHISGTTFSAADNYEYECELKFYYDEKTLYDKRDSLLVQKTNRFLKLRDIDLPIISTEDYFFSNIPHTPPYAMNCFPVYCFVKINIKGKIIKSGKSPYTE